MRVLLIDYVELVAQKLQVQLSNALINCSTIRDALSNGALQLTHVCLVLVVGPPQSFILLRVVLFEIFQLMLREEVLAGDYWMVLFVNIL